MGTKIKFLSFPLSTIITCSNIQMMGIKEAITKDAMS